MKKTVLFIYLLFWLACETTKSPNQPEYFTISFEHPVDSSYVVTPKDEMLRSAFVNQSPRQLDFFCETWYSEYAQESKKPSIQTEWDTELYKLFHDFYHPSGEYRESEYLVLQNEIVYLVVDSSKYGAGAASEFSSKDYVEIKPFWPEINDTGQKILYLSEEYTQVLNFFISEYSGQEDQYNYNWYSWDYVLSKSDFLEPKFVIMHNHWVPAFHYFSFPRVSMVIFNKDEPLAILFYRDSWCTGGADEFGKIGNEWKLKKTLYKWIE